MTANPGGRAPAATGAFSAAHGVESTSAQGPIRSCIGCRGRSPYAELLRIVAIETPSGSQATPDPRRRRPGRGAHLHPEMGCLHLAERRKAFTRALRVSGPLDLGPVREYVERASNPVD